MPIVEGGVGPQLRMRIAYYILWILLIISILSVGFMVIAGTTLTMGMGLVPLVLIGAISLILPILLVWLTKGWRNCSDTWVS